MRSRNWSNILLAASLAPSALLVAFVCWYIFMFRPSGEEQFGDSLAIIGLGLFTYPLSILLLIAGTVLAISRGRRHPSKPTKGLLLFAASVFLLIAPWLLLRTQVS